MQYNLNKSYINYNLTKIIILLKIIIESYSMVNNELITFILL